MFFGKLNKRAIIYGAALCALGLPLTPAVSVERESSGDPEENLPRTEARGSSKLGFEAESKLKTEPSGKAFFFLTNEVAWPERKEIVLPPKPPPPPALPRKRPIGPSAAEVEEPKSPADTAAGDREDKTPAKKPQAASSKTAAKALPKPPKKPAVALPDIEQLLADVRRSAQPKLSDMSQAQSLPAEIVSRPPASHEVESPVDMDALVRDLESLQKDDGVAAARKKAEVQSGADGVPWWVIAAAIAAGAGLGYLGLSLFRRRKKHIRSQSQIDAETRAFFDKLLAEQRRRGAKPRSESPAAPLAAPPPVREEPPEEAVEETEEPHVYLLPPELAAGEYREVVKLAAMGEDPRIISEKLSIGEGEVRLVLDIARLSRERMSAA